MNTDTGEIKKYTDDELAAALGVEKPGVEKSDKAKLADVERAYGKPHNKTMKPVVELTESEALVFGTYPPRRRVALYKHYKTSRLTYTHGKEDEGFVDQKTGLRVPIETGQLLPPHRAHQPAKDASTRRERRLKIEKASRRTPKKHARSRAHKPARSKS